MVAFDSHSLGAYYFFIVSKRTSPTRAVGLTVALLAVVSVWWWVGRSPATSERPWRPSLDPFAVTSVSQEPEAPRPIGGFARLDQAVRGGTVTLADSYRYRLALRQRRPEDVPAQFHPGAGEADTDLLLQKLAADLSQMSDADRRDLSRWTQSFLAPDHPLTSSQTGTVPEQKVSQRRWWLPSLGLVAPVHAAPRQICPQPPVLNLLGLDAMKCRIRVNNTVIVYWEKFGNTAARYALAQAAVTEVTAAFAFDLNLFSTSAQAFVNRHGHDTILIKLEFPAAVDGAEPALEPGETYELGAWFMHDQHHAYVNVAMDQNYPSTLAHELVHAFQLQLRDVDFEGPSDWIIEGLARWGAKAYLQGRITQFPDLLEQYLRVMSWFWGNDDPNVTDGLTVPSYAVHLYWHDLNQQRGLGEVRAAIIRHLGTGSNAAVLGGLDLPETWHDFARNLLREDPWDRIHDSPQDLPPVE